MRCIVTAGPTFEPLDTVRRLSNFSSGRLGSELAGFLSARGHDVTFLLGEAATWRGECRAKAIQSFTTTESLRHLLSALAGGAVDAVFHAAAVSDYSFGRIWSQSVDGTLSELSRSHQSGPGFISPPGSFSKLPTREGALLAELLPTPKIITELRSLFPSAFLAGWKYEVDGDRAAVIELARQQIARCRTDLCVANGPAYGPGYGLVAPAGTPTHHPDKEALFTALEMAAVRR